MYETFEHTADLGLRIRAADLNTLFAEAGRCLFSVIVENLDDVEPKQFAPIAVEGDNLEFLLFDWLNELLYRFETEQVLYSQFEVEVTSQGLAGCARGEKIDRDRHRLTHEVKAITYHGLKVEQTPDGWQAEVIVDI